jgi:hypothetical protein
MKALLLATIVAMFSMSVMAEEGCKKISETVSKCEVEEARYLVSVGKCSSFYDNNGYYRAVFSYGEKVFKTIWLEDDGGIIGGTFKKIVDDEYKKIETTLASSYSSRVMSNCNGLRDPYALQITDKRKLAALIKDFLQK